MARETPGFDTIFCAAIEIPSAEDRAAYIARACGNHEDLRGRVEKLVGAHFRAGSFMEGPAPELVATVDEPVREAPGAVVGPYKLLQQIGEGGMGTVFMAEQEQPVRRKVALKFVRPGMDSRQVVGRFEAERQALALMDHPNIAKVLDAGTTPEGRPYFVMELVKGVPITTYCDDHHLNPRERLELFIPVCHAVQHAHQKGVIHRDLKPSNVLVALYDDQPVPKVIDFGVAKATGPKLTERTLFTQFGQLVGTLEYMSPEQATFNALDVDTRSDVYSLGVLLYELLTGSTPFETKRLRAAAFDEMLRIIREEEPPRPSTRLSMTEEMPTIATNRNMEPARLSRQVRGELDWIVMKCLEKSRDRRYETANGLARDLERYLADEPVTACPPSMAYRFRRFVRRHHFAMLAGLTTLLVLIGGIIGTSWGLLRAVAEGNAKEQARQEAEANFEKSREVVDRMLTHVAQERLLDVPHMEPLRRKLLEDALEFYQGFIRARRDDPRTRLGTAQAFECVGGIDMTLGRHEEADQAFSRAIAMLEELLSEGRLSEAARTQLSGLYRSKSWTLNVLSRGHDAEHPAERSLELAEALVKEFPGKAAHRRGKLAALQHLAGMLAFSDPKRAGLLLEQAIALAGDDPSDRPGLATVYGNWGVFLQRQHRHTQAREAFGQAISILERLAEEEPRRHRNQLADLLRARANDYLFQLRNARVDVEAASKLWDAAAEDCRKAIPMFEALAADFPSTVGYRSQLASTQFSLARAWIGMKRDREAESLLRQSLANYLRPQAATLSSSPPRNGEAAATSLPVGRSPASIDPTSGMRVGEEGLRLPAGTGMTNRLASISSSTDVLSELGALLVRQGRRDEAEQQFRAIFQTLDDIEAEFGSQGPIVAHEYYKAENVLERAGRYEDAEKCGRRAIELYSEYVRSSPSDTIAWDICASTTFRLGRVRSALGRVPEAIEAYRESAALYSKLASGERRREETHFAQASLLNELARLLATCADPKARNADEAIRVAREAIGHFPKNGDFRNTLGVAQYRAGDFQAAIEALKTSMELRNGGDSTDWFFLAMASWQLGHKDEARRWNDQAIRWMEKNQPENQELRRFRAEAATVLAQPDTIPNGEEAFAHDGRDR